jgi:hypothetical protein
MLVIKNVLDITFMHIVLSKGWIRIQQNDADPTGSGSKALVLYEGTCTFFTVSFQFNLFSDSV